VARNLGREGTFGIVPGVYESASSAPLWNVIMAPVLAAVEDGWWLPLLLNALAALWLLWTMSGLPALARLGTRRRGVLVAALVPVVLGLVPLTMTGMEHTLHAALVAAYLVLLARRGSALERGGDLAWLAVLLAIGTLLRFETAFLAVASAIVLLAERPRPVADEPEGSARSTRGRRPWIAAAVLVGAAGLPALAFAGINRAFGQHTLPNSVMAKSDVARGTLLPSASGVVHRLLEDPILSGLLVVAVGILALAWWGPRQTEACRRATRALATALLTGIAHVAFADVGWFERYEAYLITGLVVGLAIVAPELRTWGSWRRWAVPVLCIACLLRVPLLVKTPMATSNTYAMQYQVGQFFDAHYGGRGVAVNDLGYVAWLHDGPVLDVIGLGSFEALEAKRTRTLDAARFAELADDADAEILVVYDDYARLVPEDWSEAGRWCVSDRLIILLHECVGFYAPDGDPLVSARAALSAYAPRLPAATTTTLAP
jgi:hypothetical protein